MKLLNKLKFLNFFTIFIFAAPIGLLAQEGTFEAYRFKHLQFGSHISQNLKITKLSTGHQIENIVHTEQGESVTNKPVLHLDRFTKQLHLKYISTLTGSVTIDCLATATQPLNVNGQKYSTALSASGFNCKQIGKKSSQQANIVRMLKTLDIVLVFDAYQAPLVCESAIKTIESRDNLIKVQASTINNLQTEIRRLNALLLAK